MTADYKIYKFGAFMLDPVKRSLQKAGQSIPYLTEKPFELLLYLVQNPQIRIPTKELCKGTWCDGHELSPEALKALFTHIYEALGENDKKNRAFIERSRNFTTFKVSVIASQANQHIMPQPESPVVTFGPGSSISHKKELDEAIRSICWDSLYHWGAVSVDAVRLTGAQDEYFPIDHIEVTWDEQKYLLPESLALALPALLDVVKANGYPFDGPCARLIDYSAFPHDSSEKKHLRLKLGPMTWFDYVIANQQFGDAEMAKLLCGKHKVTDFIDFSQLARERVLTASKLSNIVTAYLTITTSDGFLIFSQRGGHVASHKYLKISAVSENIHLIKDGVLSRPTESIFITPSRGISEELSPYLVPQSPASDVFLLGVEFHLQAFHPGFLFYLPLAKTRAEVEQACRECPGKDFLEGQIRFIHLDDGLELESVLLSADWFEAGKASIVRTLEFLSSFERTRGMSLATAASAMARRPLLSYS